MAKPTTADSPAADVQSSLISLRSLGRALLAAGAAACAALLVTGNPLGAVLVPFVLAAAAIVLGLSVFRLDAKPKARWRGMAAWAVVSGIAVLMTQFGVFG